MIFFAGSAISPRPLRLKAFAAKVAKEWVSARLRISSAAAPFESKALDTHLRRHGELDGIQPGRGRRSSHAHSRSPQCVIAWTAQHMGALQRRKRYVERLQHRRPLDCRGAHRLDAASTNHSEKWRSAAV